MIDPSLLSSDLPRLIPGEGPYDAEVVIVGEAGGREEATLRRPFVGNTGKVLEELLRGIGLPRARCRIDNVVQRRPKDNKLSNIPKDELHRWKLDCQARISALRPRVVIALGALALEALTGKKGISNWRGSLLPYGKAMLVPMHHPAFTFKDPQTRVTLDRDFRRVRDYLDGRIAKPRRLYHIRPTIEQVELWASVVCGLGDDDLLTCDIETPGFMACVGFSYDEEEAISIPTTRAFWKDTNLVMRAWRAIRAMCQSKVTKVMQHGLFDAYWLRRVGRIELKNWQWDLMCMHHCLAPLEPHDLAYITSMYRDWYVFWKTEAKDPESVQRYARDIDALYTYNGMDCCEQRGLFDPLHQAMVERGVVGFYDQHYRALMPHLLDLMCHGFRVDARERARRAAQARCRMLEIEDQLAEVAGEKVYAKKSLKRKVIEKLVYETLQCPKTYNKASGALTTDVFTLQRLTHKYPKKMKVVGPLIMTHRKQEKLGSFLEPKKVDQDGRFRSSYGFDPATGRFSSGPNPLGTGDNAQNQDRRIRDTFLADEGCLLLKVDRSQVESRIVDMLTLHPWHVDRARSSPWERDVHREVAAVVFKKSEGDVTEDERYLCKRAKYAGCYDIQGSELSRQFAKEAIFIGPSECQKIIDKTIEEPIRKWQQRVRGLLMRDRVLGNTWGWTLDFTGMRLDRETYKKGYAFVPQSENAFDLHHLGFLPVAVEIKQGHFKAAINGHIHDELVISVVPSQVYDLMLFIRAQLERPRPYSQAGSLVVPCTWGLGLSWKTKFNWDRFPTRKEVEEAIDGLQSQRL